MSNLDPDVLAVLQSMAATGEKAGERRRVQAVRKKHEQQSVDRLETQLELLFDEIEAAGVPRTHPLFKQVLFLTIAHKLARVQTRQQIEYKSCLEEGLFLTL